MLHLVLCFGVWTLIFSCLCWRLIAVSKQAVQHLQRLHHIPCNKCVYFTGDYRLKCTVNPTTAMSETAIGCRDFVFDSRASICNGCAAKKQCSNTSKKPQYSMFKS